MANIICHIVGINNFIKESFLEYMEQHYKEIIIYDLDNITNMIRNTKEMVDLCTDLDKTHKNSNNRTNLSKQVNNLWKSSFLSKIEKILNINMGKHIIFIGLSTFHKNHKLKIKIDTKNNFFLKYDPKKNAQNIIEYNLDKYKKNIINGSFPLKYLDFVFLVNQRERLINIYKNIGFKMKTLKNFYKWIDTYYSYHIKPYSEKPNSSLNESDINKILNKDSEHTLYVVSSNNYDNFIKVTLSNIAKRKAKNEEFLAKNYDTVTSDNIIIGYSQEWLALIHSIKDISKYIKKGISKIGLNIYPTIKEKVENGFSVLNADCYIYTINNNNFNKIKNYSYNVSQTVKIQSKKYIGDIMEELKNIGVKFINYKKV